MISSTHYVSVASLTLVSRGAVTDPVRELMVSPYVLVIVLKSDDLFQSSLPLPPPTLSAF